MTRVGDGIAGGSDLPAAAESATADALAPLQGLPPDLVCVFVCSDSPEVAEQAARRVGTLSRARVLLGCTAAGVLGAGRGLERTSSVSVWAASLPGASLRGFHLEVLPTDEGAAVVGLPERSPGDVAAVLLADPFSFPADGFVTRTNHALPGLPLVGGLASGVAGRGSTRLFLDGRAVARGAVGVMVGDTPVTPLVSQGCRPVGPPMTVTRSEGNVLLELAGVPALDKVEAVVSGLDGDEQRLVAAGLHLGIARDEYVEELGRGDFLVRGVLGGDRDRGGLVVGDLVEVGTTVRLQVRDAEGADRELREMLGRARERSPAGPVAGALLFSCVGRGASLFGGELGDADHDVLAVRDGLGAGGVAGFFADGEIGPVAGRNYLHGFTASMLLFGEASAAPALP
jgi:small ligand-binding sensory domain FIST